MTTILKAEGKGELLTAVTTLLGYTPTESLVIAPFRGTRSHGALRVDLPTATDADALAAYTAEWLGTVVRLGGVTMIAAAIYTDGDQARHALLAETLRTMCDLLGLDVAAIFYATPATWGRVLHRRGAHRTGPGPRQRPRARRGRPARRDRASRHRSRARRCRRLGDVPHG